MTSEKLNVIDLFCGCGGMSKGLSDAGLNVVAGIDIWAPAIKSYKKNFNHLALCEDLTKFSPENLKQHLGETKIDIIAGGFPCTSFSLSGKRDINDPRGKLYLEYVKYVKYYRPKAFIIENVIGILSMKAPCGNKVIDLILRNFDDYNLLVSKLYASDFEVPQIRRRVIITGIRKDLGIVPTEPAVVKNKIVSGDIILDRNHPEIKGCFLSEKAIQGIKNKKEKSIERGAGFGAQFIDLQKPCYTIPARYWKDGYDALLKYSETEIRRLCITELKRVQGFPDNYIIEGTKKDIIIQIGNAVAAKFAFHIGTNLKKLLE